MREDDDIRAWLRGLGKTPERQISALRTLLQYARIDGMSAEDLAICRRELARLTDATGSSGDVRRRYS